MNLSYYSTTVATTLDSSITAGETSVTLVDGSTFPDPAVPGNGQYTVILALGTDREEVCTVTAKTSVDVLTLTRGEDSTAAVAKNAGDSVVHGVTARDFNYLRNATPIGEITMYGASTAPSGWHLCDGTAHGSTALEAVIGSANTPDLRDRFIVAAGSTYTSGDTGGADSVTLTATESGVAAHSHTASTATDGGHSHSVNPPATTSSSEDPTITMSFTSGKEGGNELGGGELNYLTDGSGLGGGGVPLTADQSAHTHSVNIAAFNSSTDAGHTHGMTVDDATAASAASAHENRPPYYALTFIIRG